MAAVAALFALNYLGTGSLFSMDVLDQLWWALAALVVARLLRRDAPRLWLIVGVIGAVALLTKLTVLFFGLALVLGLLVTPARRYLRTPWPWLAGGIAFVGGLPYILWNAANGWPTVEFWQHYGGVGTSPLDFFTAQIGQLNPLAFPLAVAGLVFYFRPAGARFRMLGWTVVFAYLVLTLLGTKPYFLAPTYPILFAGGGVMLERFQPRRWIAWVRPAYVGLIVLTGLLLAPDVMPILPPDTTVQVYGHLEQVLSDRLGWDSLTQTVEQVYAALPPAQQAQACVLASNYGEAGALQQLGAPGRLPPVISPHNNYFLWGPGGCTGQVIIAVGYSLADLQVTYTQVTLGATRDCPLCIDFEQTLPIYIATDPKIPNPMQQWDAAKHFD